jgi:glycosyltransferase involved in cell wall biosynthesis
MFVKTYKRMCARPVTITNSRYSEEAIKRVLGTKANVVYPPVATSKFRTLPKKRRSNTVLTISRLDQSKNLDVLPQLAKSVPNAKFIVIGATDRRSDSYLNGIVEEAKRLGVDGRVTIKPNCGETEKLNLLMQAKVYLHTMRNEHFGISIVEGMSAGLVPVVHKSGGPWFDILGTTQGQFGYAYTTIDEAAGFITEILRDQKLRARLSEGAQKRADYFDIKHFRGRMLAIVRPMLELKTQSN